VVNAFDDALELGIGKEGGCAAAEVDEFELAVFEAAAVGVEIDFAGEGGEIGFDFVGVFVGVDAEVAELTAFSAEGDVEVEAQAGVILRGVIEGLIDGGELGGRPDGEWGVVGDEVAADLGFFGFFFESGQFHRWQSRV
jgi:hypothetical protein